MSVKTVYLALGSNLANPVQQLVECLTELQAIPHTQKQAHSPLYRTKPLGPLDQPDFVNAVVELSSELSAATLLDELQLIEQRHGRRRGIKRWGARTLDIDIMLYGNEVIRTPRLTIPHPELLNRDFWLIPLATIVPNLVLPDGNLLKDYIQQFNQLRYILDIVQD